MVGEKSAVYHKLYQTRQIINGERWQKTINLFYEFKKNIQNKAESQDKSVFQSNNDRPLAARLIISTLEHTSQRYVAVPAIFTWCYFFKLLFVSFNAEHFFEEKFSFYAGIWNWLDDAFCYKIARFLALRIFLSAWEMGDCWIWQKISVLLLLKKSSIIVIHLIE